MSKISNQIILRLKEFAEQFNGEIAFPDSIDYKKSVKIDNGRIQYHPLAILYPFDSKAVAEAVNMTKKWGIHLTVLNGGHNAVGWCLNHDGVVLHLKHMNYVNVDPINQQVTFGCGTLWKNVYEAMAKSGYVAIGGGVLGVGVSGFVLGGGYSYLSRSKGLGIDNLESIKVVTADGQIRTLSHNEPDPRLADLFWALRGGGGGNFGIATEMTCRIHPEVKNVLGGVIEWDINDAKRVLMVYKDWVMQVPKEMDPLFLLSKGKSPSDPPMLIMLIYYNGPYKEGLKIVQPMLALKPKTNNLIKTDFYSFINLYGGVTSSQQLPSYIKAGNLKQTISEAFIDSLIEGIKSAPGRDTQIGVEYAGGVISEVSPNATAYYWREIVARWEIKATWKDRSKDQENIDWAIKLASDIKPENYGADVNQQDQFLVDWRSAYYSENLERLKKIKKEWDPDNYFNFPQSI